MPPISGIIEGINTFLDKVWVLECLCFHRNLNHERALFIKMIGRIDDNPLGGMTDKNR